MNLSRPQRPCATPGCPRLVARGHCPTHARVRGQARNEAKPWRAWYGGARWLAMRRLVLNRQPLCADCLAADRLTPATEVHHVEAHRGDPVRFYDVDNLQALCQRCHARRTGLGE